MANLINKNGEYAFLPTELRDFHEQKDLFKDMQQYIKGWVEKMPSYMQDDYKNISWVNLHVLTTDFVLYQLAQRGYVLRKCDKFKVEEEKKDGE